MPNRWLLYDSGCSVCAALAQEVKARSGGQLRVRSLREPEVQALLDRARPGWQWEPMLVEVEGERVRVLAGLSLRARLVQVLGPAQALRMTQLTLAGAPSSSPVRA
jgi:predicted DCC family thiol-disulfide oxidoreductase YuxK